MMPSPGHLHVACILVGTLVVCTDAHGMAVAGQDQSADLAWP